MTTARRSLTLLALLGAGVLLLAGCATAATPGSDGTDDQGAPSGTELELDAAWLDGGRSVALVTLGSSTCVPMASEVAVQADGSVAVTLEDPAGDTACTRDYVQRATLVSLPVGVDATKDLDLVVTYGDARGETDLDAYAGPQIDEYAPSASWVDDGVLAILTWGSSSCAPRVSEATASGAEVSVVFVDPPADQVCTMDMGPRVLLANVDGASDDAATLILSGGGAEFATPVTVAIARD